MGEVWQGFDQTLGRRIAVKLIHTDLRDNTGVAGQALRRFRREAAAAARLNHRNITTVYDFGEHTYTDRHGRVHLVPFLVLEFLEGHDLGLLLQQSPAGLPLDKVLDWGIQTCAGLAAAHRAGIVHRDIKPANLMLLTDGTIKVCDFGIASLPDVTLGLTSHGAPMGTPGYMPPEQEQGRPVDHRADLHALGVTLHRLLTGLGRNGATSGVYRTRISGDLDDLIGALVAEQPEERPASADEVAYRLRAILGPGSARSHISEPLPPPPDPDQPAENSMFDTRREAVAQSGPEPQLPWPVPQQLPPPSSVFVGRQDALTALTSLLPGDGACEAVVISAIAGGAGIGKTTLAVHWAHQIADRFPDGVLFVNLRGYDPAEPLSPLQALDGFLRALDVPATKIPDELQARSALFRSLLAHRRLLVVLDNAADAGQVRPLLPATPGCLALITSRSHLAGLATREGAHRVPLDLLSPDQALQLLRRTIGTDRVDAEPDQAHELARRCGYLPLALRIAADRAENHPHLRLADLVAELTDEHHRLDALATGDDPTTAVRTVFSWSYRRIPEPTAQTFRLLGLHTGPDISLPAAAALLDLTIPQARAALDTLTGQHLLQHNGRDRYRFHDLLSVYAAERAAQDQPPRSRDQAIERLFTWYLHTADTARSIVLPQGRQFPRSKASTNEPPAVSFTSYSQALAWFKEERTNLVSAVRQTAELGYNSAAWRLAFALGPFLFVGWYPDDMGAVLDIGLAAAQRQGDKIGQALLLNVYSDWLWDLGRYRESLESAEKVLPLAQQGGDQLSEGNCHVAIGRAHIKLGEFGMALGHLQQALSVFQNIAERRGEGIALANLSAAHLGLEQINDAIVCSQKAAAILEETRNPGSQAFALRQLGEAYNRQRRYCEAIRHFEKAINLLRTIESQRQIGVYLTELGRVHLAAGQPDQGRQRLQEALTILTPLEHSDVAEIRSLLSTRESGTGTAKS